MGILYHHHHHIVATAPTTNKTAVAAQVDQSHCLITVQHDCKAFCDNNDVSSSKDFMTLQEIILLSFSWLYNPLANHEITGH